MTGSGTLELAQAAPGKKVTKYFTSGFFSTKDGKASALSEGRVQSFEGVYELRKTPSLKSIDSKDLNAFVAKNGTGFVLPVPADFSGKASITLSLVKDVESEKNKMCANIVKGGFVVKK